MSDSRHDILYIEDNGSNILLMERIIASRPNWQLESVTTSAHGLLRLTEDTPDLLLLDLDMPDMPGLEVLHLIRKHPDFKHLPVLIVSADATPGRIERLLDAGADGYITKPFSVKDLIARIDSLLSGGVAHAA